MAEPPKQSSSTSRAYSIGMELAAAVAGFTLVGYWIDRHYHTGPWGILIGVALGLVGGMYNLIRSALASSREAGSGINDTNGDHDG
jgi:F0F1-type ATP synthase assembly protein I